VVAGALASRSYGYGYPAYSYGYGYPAYGYAQPYGYYGGYYAPRHYYARRYRLTRKNSFLSSCQGRVETTGLARHQATSLARASLTISESVPEGPHDPPHAGIDFIWDQSSVRTGSLQHSMQVRRLNRPLTQRVPSAGSLARFDGTRDAGLVQASGRGGRCEVIRHGVYRRVD
jgi:hypothetical protein